MWQNIFEVLSDQAYKRISNDRCHHCQSLSACHGGKRETEEAFGRSKGGLSTKIRATCDALGNPTRFYLSPGQCHDLQGAEVFLADSEALSFLADNANDADERVRKALIGQGIEPVIPGKSNRKVTIDYDKELY